jgi:hypothetical protein
MRADRGEPWIVERATGHRDAERPPIARDRSRHGAEVGIDVVHDIDGGAVPTSSVGRVIGQYALALVR